jgi:hypothetical protein
MMIVFMIQILGGIWSRDKLMPIQMYNSLPPERKKEFSASQLIFITTIGLLPIIVTLPIIALLIWFSCYKRYTVMAHILAYGSIIPISALYIWRFFIVQKDFIRVSQKELTIETYFFSLFLMR